MVEHSEYCPYQSFTYQLQFSHSSLHSSSTSSLSTTQYGGPAVSGPGLFSEHKRRSTEEKRSERESDPRTVSSTSVLNRVTSTGSEASNTEQISIATHTDHTFRRVLYPCSDRRGYISFRPDKQKTVTDLQSSVTLKSVRKHAPKLYWKQG